MLWSIGLCWFTGLVLAKLPLATSVQVFCSKWAEVVDAPTNIRKSPSSPSAIVFQLPRNGMVLLVYPLGTDPNQQAPAGTPRAPANPAPRAAPSGWAPPHLRASIPGAIAGHLP